MARGPYLTRRGSIFWCRIRVPVELVSLIGRRDLRRSLGTKDISDARDRCARASLLARSLFAKIRKTKRSESVETIRDIVRQFYERQLDRDGSNSVALAPDADCPDPSSIPCSGDFDQVEKSPDVLDMDPGSEAVMHGLRHGELGMSGSYAAAHDDHPSVRALCHHILRELRGLNLRYDEHAKGVLYREPSEPRLERAPVTSQPAPSCPPPTKHKGRLALRITEAVARCLDERTDIKSKTIDDYRRTGNWFVAIVGEKQIGDVERDDIGRFRDVLARIPPNFSSRLGVVDPLEALKLAKTRDLPIMSAVTINNKYMSVLRSLFAWAIREHPGHPDPTRGVIVERSGARRRGKPKNRSPFGLEELATIFNAPLFAGCAGHTKVLTPGGHRRRDHYFWVPLLALYTGCRLNELGQLDVADIVRVDGAWHILIRETSDADDREDGQRRPSKQLKTENARRRIPVHGELERIGFLSYVEDVRATGSARLFPYWPIGADGYYSSVFSKWFNRTFLGGIGVKNSLLCFHSLRHNFKDFLRDIGLDGEARRSLMGHTAEDAHESYGLRQLRAHEIETFRKSSYAGLDLTHISYDSPSPADGNANRATRILRRRRKAIVYRSVASPSRSNDAIRR